MEYGTTVKTFSLHDDVLAKAVHKVCARHVRAQYGAELCLAAAEGAFHSACFNVSRAGWQREAYLNRRSVARRFIRFAGIFSRRV